MNISPLSSVLVPTVAGKRLALLHLFDQDYKARTITSEYEEVAILMLRELKLALT